MHTLFLLIIIIKASLKRNFECETTKNPSAISGLALSRPSPTKIRCLDKNESSLVYSTPVSNEDEGNLQDKDSQVIFKKGTNFIKILELISSYQIKERNKSLKKN